jgi:predicted transport protein/predicted ATP-dependent endonuclease of OLD family
MKIKELYIKNYKNLDADLIHKSDLIAFIGNNGSGKSNLLEALSHIFRNLYKPTYKVDFDYTIEYITSKSNTVRVEKQRASRIFFVDGTPMPDINQYLPQKVVAIYSGEEERLFEDCYGPFYLEFVKNINKAQQQGTDYSNLPKMLFLNKFYWHLSLLSLLISNSESNKKFVKEVLKIDSVEKIKIDFQKKNYEHYNDNLALKFIRDIDAKNEYKLDEFKKLIDRKGYEVDDLYKYLYLAYTPKGSKIIEDITIKFNKTLTITDLSEGEKKLLLIKAALEFAGQEDSLFILDEPDAHVHLNNKEQIIRSFEPYKSNRQIVITTHSPTITQAIQDENVYMLIAGKIEDKNRQEIIEEITGEFWNKHQQNSFLAAKKPIVLLVEGKHDKEHINLAFYKLKDEYPELSFDIFYMNSACNIPPMMLGLRTSEIEYNKLCIGIFDVDTTGNKELSHTECQFPNIQNKKRHELGFYATGYPKHAAHRSEFFTVENFYDTQHLLDAYQNTLNSIATHVNGKSIESINEKLKDLTKSNLLAKAKTFTDKEDFKNFRLLFDVIKAIKVHYAANKKHPVRVVVTATTANDTKKHPAGNSTNEKAVKKAVKKAIIVKAQTYTEKEHLENTNAEIAQLYHEFKTEILKLSKEIKVSPKKIRISFETGGKIVADIAILKKSLKLWINLKKGELKDSKKLARDVSEVGHWGNGDYEITITSNKDIEYIISLIKQAH